MKNRIHLTYNSLCRNLEGPFGCSLTRALELLRVYKGSVSFYFNFMYEKIH